MPARPRALPAQYKTPYGTRWEKEKADAGGAHMFDLRTDPKTLGPWILGECVGKGASGRVKIAKHARTGQLAAVKILPLPAVDRSLLCSDKQAIGIYREMTMMKLMRHPNIMRIYDVYEGGKELYLVLEYVAGGELFDYLVNHGRFEPEEALDIFRQIIYGLNYAHTFSIIHRDLKPENILVASVSPPVIKIADWGMAAFAPPSFALETSCGSPHYASPEIVRGHSYWGTATDIWSCGVILYALLTCKLPFDDKDHNVLLEKVKMGFYEIPSYVDPLAQDLIQRMLVVEPSERITIPEILLHPWFLSTPNTLTPHLPPSPSILARPIPSRDLVDPDLLKSLLYIWGRHTDPYGEAIIQDLCSPAGYGVHAKAFYYLLVEYRGENMRHKLDEDRASEDIDNPVVQRYSGRSNFVEYSPLRSEVPVHSKIKYVQGLTVAGRKFDPLADSRTRGLASSPAISGSKKVSPEAITHRYSRIRQQLSPLKEVYPAPLVFLPREDASKEVSRMEFARQPQQKVPIPQAKLEQHGRYPKSFIEVPAPPKGGVARVIRTRSLSQSRIPRYTASPACATEPLSLRKPLSDVTSRHTQAEANRAPQAEVSRAPQPEGSKAPQSEARRPSQSETSKVPQFEASPVTPLSRVLDYPWVVLPQENSAAYTPLKAKAHEKSRKARRISKRWTDEKENWGPRTKGWQLFKVDKGGREEVALNHERDFVREDPNVDGPVATASAPKRQKLVKDKFPPLDQPTLRRKKSLFSLPTSPRSPALSGFHSPSSPSHSAVRYRAKGWFSNLFNWKNNPDWQQDVLFSPHDVKGTRIEAAQLLTRFGVTVEHESISGAVYPANEPIICRVDVLTIMSNVTLKPTRFRIELSPFSPPIPSHAPEDSCHLTTPPVNPNYPFSSDYNTGTNSPRTHGDEEVPAPKCIIAFVYEKGSVSTCKAIWQKLRNVYGDEPMSSPRFIQVFIS